MKIRPLAKTMLIKKIKEEKKSLIIVSETTTGPFKAELLAKGKQVDLDVEVGDILLMNQYGPVQFDKDDEEHFLVTEREILGVVLDEKVTNNIGIGFKVAQCKKLTEDSFSEASCDPTLG